MYCPRCGRRQDSDGASFCTGCGLQLGAVSELLSGDSLTVAGAAREIGAPAYRRAPRLGAKIMFLGLVLAPVSFAFAVLFQSPVPFLIPFAVFFAGLSQWLYVRIFGEPSVPAAREERPAELGAAGQRLQLSSFQAMPVSAVDSERWRTAELTPPPSVTESTTELLKREEP